MAISQEPTLARALSVTRSAPVYPVIKQEGYLVTVRNSPCIPLVLGQVLKFDAGAKGVVIFVNDAIADLELDTLVDVKTGGTFDWLPYSDYVNYKVFVPENLLGAIDVVCANTKTNSPGFLGWSLFDVKDRVIVMGNDLAKQNTCKYNGTGVWGRGIYQLEVRSFIPGTFQPIAYAKRDFVVTTTAAKLSLGNYNDMEGPLVLK